MNRFNRIKIFFHLNELRGQLVFWMVTVTLVPLIVFTTGLYYLNFLPMLNSLIGFNQRLLSGNILSEQTNEAGRLADQISAFLKDVKTQTIFLSRLLAISPNPPAADTGLLSEMIGHYSWLDYIVIRDTRDKVSSFGRENAIFSEQLQIVVSDSLLFQRTLAGEIAFSQPFRVAGTDEIAMTMSIPIVSEYGKPLGGLFVQVNLLDVQLMTDQAAKTNPGTIYVVDSEGILLGHVDRQRVLDRENMSELEIVGSYLIPRITVGSLPYKNKENQDVQGAYAPVSDFNWGVVTERSVVRAFGIVTEMMNQSNLMLKELAIATLLGMFFTAILASSIGAFLAVKIASPIREIAKGAYTFAKGKFSQRFHVKASTDIEQLANTLNFMGDSIEKHTRDLQKQARDMRMLFLGSVESLAAAIDAKDPYTKGHSRRVTEISLMLGTPMGLNAVQMEELEIASLMHDVGKIGIDDAILKKPSVVTEEERQILQMHPVHGAAIMRPIPLLQNMIPGMLHHHERWDGSGYPMGLKGDDIPLYGRIIAVADTFDAMTSDRPYQKTYTFEEAKELICEYSGERYDPAVVSSFIKVYPEICSKVLAMRK